MSQRCSQRQPVEILHSTSSTIRLKTHMLDYVEKFWWSNVIVTSKCTEETLRGPYEVVLGLSVFFLVDTFYWRPFAENIYAVKSDLYVWKYHVIGKIYYIVPYTKKTQRPTLIAQTTFNSICRISPSAQTRFIFTYKEVSTVSFELCLLSHIK